MIAELESELKDLNYGLSIIKEIKIEDYIEKRINSDKVIDTAHIAEGSASLPSQYQVPRL